MTSVELSEPPNGLSTLIYTKASREISLDAFVYMSVLNPFGGSDNSTLVMSQQLWDSFQNARYGLACAQGVVICLFTLTFAGIVGLVSRLTGGKDSVTLA